jgi:hypothetical protein
LRTLSMRVMRPKSKAERRIVEDRDPATARPRRSTNLAAEQHLSGGADVADPRQSPPIARSPREPWNDVERRRGRAQFWGRPRDRRQRRTSSTDHVVQRPRTRECPRRTPPHNARGIHTAGFRPARLTISFDVPRSGTQPREGDCVEVACCCSDVARGERFGEESISSGSVVGIDALRASERG